MGAALSLEPGTLFARDFRIERPLAEGGMGAVYVVQQISTGRRRALKVMQPDLLQDDNSRRRFVLEAKIGARIASEHVVEVQLAGIDEQTGAPFLVMELLDGEDLHTRLERQRRLAIDEVRELFRQMCHALHLAHEAGIVHRDLKPANVFLAAPKRTGDTKFHVKVLDFGIAKMTHDATAGAKTGMIGTPLWMAPEQADHVPVTPAADVWALGLMLYTSLTGWSFWRNGNLPDVSLQQIFREMLFDPIPSAVARAREQGASFPESLDAVIARSVVRRPSERFSDAGAFFEALERALDGKGEPKAAATALPYGSMLEAPDFDAPLLELAVEPTRPVAVARPASPSPTADTLALPPPPRPMAVAPGPALLADKKGWPWWLFFALPVAVAAVLVVALWSLRKQGDASGVTCRLCTVEHGTFANGTTPLRDLRHDIEERFPELDALCLKDASGPGRAKLHWVAEGGDFGKDATATGGGRTGLCLLSAISHRPAPMVMTQGAGFGHTEITYILEWNPSVTATWPKKK